ncbi:MAG TPA: hypothetical protein VJ065_02845 [Patescibacteria group bacterium]|nr:hypothetical protein [Patescibacteria group bacterium]
MCRERACFCFFAEPGFKKVVRNLKAQMRPEVSGGLSPKSDLPSADLVKPKVDFGLPVNSQIGNFSAGFDKGSL